MTHHDAHPGGPPDLSEVMVELIAAGPTVRELVDAYIVATVEACGGSRRAAAKRLGVSWKTIYNRMDAMSCLCKNCNN